MAHWIETTDYHTAGEPFRILHRNAPVPEGTTVGDRRISAMAPGSEANAMRELLCHEPRGHADMYGGFIVPPNPAAAGGSPSDFGVLFWHKDGFSTACGHGTIALGVWATESGLVDSDPDGVTEVRIDVPSGTVAALVERREGQLVEATFRNVASHVVARNVPVATSRGEVRVDLSFSGAIYASVRAADLGTSVSPDNYPELIALGREVKRALHEAPEAQHPADPRLGGVYGTILWDDLGRGPGGPRQRNVTVFADGEVDRSPCGSGTGARVALLAADGSLGSDEVLEHRSIVDTVFRASWEPAPETGASAAQHTVIPFVSGSAFLTGEHRFTLSPLDQLGTGFALR